MVKKWLSYDHILPERLGDSCEDHMGQKGILMCSFVPKRSKTTLERLGDSNEIHLGQKWVLGC